MKVLQGLEFLGLFFISPIIYVYSLLNIKNFITPNFYFILSLIQIAIAILLFYGVIKKEKFFNRIKNPLLSWPFNMILAWILISVQIAIFMYFFSQNTLPLYLFLSGFIVFLSLCLAASLFSNILNKSTPVRIYFNDGKTLEGYCLKERDDNFVKLINDDGKQCIFNKENIREIEQI